MKWLEETHSARFELVRHFLARMFDSELFSTQGQWQKVIVGGFALAFTGGMILLDPSYAGKYRALSALPTPGPFRAAAIADELSLITFAAAITGLIALLQWQSLFPSRRDCMALAALPVRAREIFAARFLAVLLFSMALVVILNCWPSVLVPSQFVGRWQKNPDFMVNLAAHAVSSGLACLFLFFGFVALQGVLLNLLPGRVFSRVSSLVQAVFMAVLFLAALYSWSISDWNEAAIAGLPRFADWAPPVWFVGLHERMLGDRDPFYAGMAVRALAATAGVVILALLAYIVSYRRYRAILLENKFDVAAPRERRWSLLGLLAGDPRREAVVQFIAKTLTRSRLHRLVLLAYIGGALALVLNNSLMVGTAQKWARGWHGAFNFAVLSWPLSVTVIVLSGLRHSFSMPAELPSNWIFRLTESQGRAEWMSALERFVITCAVAPIYVVLAPFSAALLGWDVALRMTALQVVISMLMFEVRFQSWQQMPFTCSYVPGKRPMVGVVACWIAVLGALVPVLTFTVMSAGQHPEPFLIFGTIFTFAWIWARRMRRDGWGEAPLLYEDLTEVVPNIGLRS